MHSFYVFKRKGRKYEYVQFVDPVTKKLMAARSTGKKNHEDAEQQAIEWLYSGNLTRTKAFCSVKMNIEQKAHKIFFNYCKLVWHIY